MRCAVNGCKNSHRRHPKGVSFHRFPEDEKLRKMWIKAIKYNRKKLNITKYTVVCSDHFLKEEIQRFSSRAYLREDSVPSLYLSPNDTKPCSSHTTSRRKNICDEFGEAMPVQPQAIQNPSSMRVFSTTIFDGEPKRIDFKRQMNFGVNENTMKSIPTRKMSPTIFDSRPKMLNQHRKFKKKEANVHMDVSYSTLATNDRSNTQLENESSAHSYSSMDANMIDTATQSYIDAHDQYSKSKPFGDSQTLPASNKIASTFDSGMQMNIASELTERIEDVQPRQLTINQNAIMNVEREDDKPQWPRDYICSTPIAYIQAVKIGKNGRIGLMKFTSTISRGTQTLIKDLPLPIPKELLHVVSDTTDLGRFVPVNVVFPDEEVVTMEELEYLQEEVEKLKKIHEGKIRDIRRVKQQTIRKMARVRTLKENLIDLKTPPGQPRPPVVTDSEDSLLDEEDELMIPDEEQLPDSTTENHSSVANQNTLPPAIANNNSTVATDNVSSSTAPNNSIASKSIAPIDVKAVTVQTSWKVVDAVEPKVVRRLVKKPNVIKSVSKSATTPNAFLVTTPKQEVCDKLKAALFKSRSVNTNAAVTPMKGLDGLTVPHVDIAANFNAKNMPIISDDDNVHIVLNPSAVQVQKN